VLQYRALEHWDGKLPQYNGGGQIPMLTIDATKLATGMDEATRERKLKDLLAEGAKAPTPPAAAPAAAPAPAPPPAAAAAP
jgi:hypothetical protein